MGGEVLSRKHMMMNSRFRASGWVATLVLVAGGVGAATAADDTIPYVDPAFGFEMKLPAGWNYDRSRFQQFEDSIGVLRGRGPGGRAGLQVQVFRLRPTERAGADGKLELAMPSFEEWVVDFARALGDMTGAERIEWDTCKYASRVGAQLEYDTVIGAATTRNYTVCLPLDAGIVWVMVYSGTTASRGDERDVERACENIARSLRVHYDAADFEELAEAFQRGRVLIKRVRARGSEVRLDEQERLYEILVDGKGVGYLRRRITSERHDFSGPGARFSDVRPGLRVRERSWRFADDGTVRHTRLDLFSSFDGQNELIEHQLTQLPAPDVDLPPLVKTNQVIRKDQALVVSYTTSLDQTMPDPAKPQDVGPVYLDQAWLRVAPGLLLTAPAESHAFAVYNTEARAVLPQTITPLGPTPLPGHEGDVYGFEVREGLMDAVARLYTDRRGNLLELRAGELLVKKVRAEEVERRYGGRREAARKRAGLSLPG